MLIFLEIVCVGLALRLMRRHCELCMSLGQLGRGAYDLGGGTVIVLTFGLYDA
jgi:hypothetical protein